MKERANALRQNVHSLRPETKYRIRLHLCETELRVGVRKPWFWHEKRRSVPLSDALRTSEERGEIRRCLWRWTNASPRESLPTNWHVQSNFATDSSPPPLFRCMRWAFSTNIRAQTETNTWIFWRTMCGRECCETSRSTQRKSSTLLGCRMTTAR